MVIVNVLDEGIHVSQIACVAAFPLTNCDLVSALATIIILEAAADKCYGVGRVWQFTRSIRRYRGRRRWGWDIFVYRGNWGMAVPGRDACPATFRRRHL